MQVIITAAGLGSRLGSFTTQRPKCTLQVGEHTILEHQLAAFAEHGLDRVVVVRGHAAEYIDAPGAAFVDNSRYASTNVLCSLMCAESYMEDGFISTYSDIVFDSEVVATLLSCDDDIAAIVDTDWRKAYIGRDLHPESEAEKVVFDDQRWVRRIGKVIERPHQAQAEHIGMIKCTPRGARMFRSLYARAAALFGDRAFLDAPRLESALVTHFLQHLVDHKVRVRAVPIAGGWREIDTPQDLETVRRVWRTKELCP